MSDDEPTTIDAMELSNRQREVIRTTCAEWNFPLGEISRHGEVLALSPTTLDELPNAGRLSELADALEQHGYRYVTFAVPHTDF